MKSKNYFAIAFLAVIIIILLALPSILRYIFPYSYRSSIEKYSKFYKLNSFFVVSVIRAESNFDKNAVSKKGALGLMQLTPETAKWACGQMGIDYKGDNSLLDADTNINIGCFYLSHLSGEFNGDPQLILASYNGGIGNVKKWLNDENISSSGKKLEHIPFKETDTYVKKVTLYFKIYNLLYKK